jgi:hypothetical protein
MTPGRLTAPTTPVPVPRGSEVGELLQTLTGRPVEVGTAAPVLPGHDPALVAVYVTDDLVVGAVLACELSLAAAAGAALATLPPGEAEQAVAAGALLGDLADNAHEVLNVLVSIFNVARAPALKLHRVHAVGEQLPDDVRPVLGYVMGRVDVQVDIEGYGGGRLSVVAVG